MIAELEAVKLVEKEYPGYTAKLVADHDGKYYVNIVQNGDPDNLADFHTVDKSTGEVSGNIPFGKILEIPQVLEQINNGLKKKMK